MRQIDHPNIIKLIDFSESRQYYYIILELAPGGELFHQIVRLTYFSEDLSRHVITQVAKALEYLHEERGIVHRYVSCPGRGSPMASTGVLRVLTSGQRHQTGKHSVRTDPLCPVKESKAQAAGR